jgi:hypothetical protein
MKEKRKKKIFNRLRGTFFFIAGLFCLVRPGHATDFMLAWAANTEPDLAGYKIYYDTEPAPPYYGIGADQGASPIAVPIASSNFDEHNPEYLLTGLDDGRAYYVVLTAYDLDGHESRYSSELRTPSISIISPSDGFYINTSNYNHYTVYGRADASAVVELFGGDTSLGTTTASDGTWAIEVDFSSAGASEGEVSLTAVSGGVTSFAVTGTYDKTPPGFPVITTNGGNPLVITATFNEPIGGTPQITIDRPDPMSTIGPVDMHGSGRVWAYDMDMGQNNDPTVFGGLYVVTISNARDLAGNDMPENSGHIFTVDTGDTNSDGAVNLDGTDDDNDGLPGYWEEANGLDDHDSDGINGKDGDFDNDGWTNYQEYLRGTDPSDETSFPTPLTPEIVAVIPYPDAGITDDTRIPNDTSFCVRIKAPDGIDINYPGSIVFTVDDGGVPNEIDLDDADDVRLGITKLDPNEDDTAVTQLWAVYHSCEDDARGNSFPYGRTVSVWVYAVDNNGLFTERYFQFKIETETEHEEAKAKLLELNVVEISASELEDTQEYDAGIAVTGGDLRGAKIVYDSHEPVTPTFGPADELPDLEMGGVGVPMNLQPPTVFSKPVKIFIPCPGRADAGDLGIYLYNGTDWVFACDAAGNVQPGGDGWMVPGSRVNHANTAPPTIEIKVYHFTGVQAGLDTTYLGGGGGGGCFIASADQDSILESHVSLLHESCDGVLISRSVDQVFVDACDQYTPKVAGLTARHNTLQAAVRKGLTLTAGICYMILHTITARNVFILLFMLALGIATFVVIQRLIKKCDFLSL